jgi:amino-acid N-acetyltransferase
MTSASLSSPIARYFERQLAGHVVAHKIAGTHLEDERIREEVLEGIATLMQHRVKCLLVCGAGSALNEALGGKQVHPRTKLRITETKDLPIIEAAIRGIGETLSDHCRRLGIDHAVLPHSVTRATRLLDGHKQTGGIVSVDRDAIQRVLDEGKLAIVPFGGVDLAGNTLNVHADDVAARAAAAVGACKLILYTSEPGILAPGKGGKWKKLNFLDFQQLFHLIRAQDADGSFVIGEKLLPRVRAIHEALAYGVPQVHVVQAKAEALLEELFTRTGSGTLIEREPFLQLDFPAQPSQLDDIVQLRLECSRATTPSGTPLLKPLSADELARLLPTTLVLRQRDLIVGTVFFQSVKGHDDTAILGGFAVGENHQDSGYGRLLLESALEQIDEAGYKRAISVTAADPVKHLYEQYGRKATSDWPDVLAAAQPRYGADAPMVDVYQFDVAST